jgi:hypothetical protein
LLVIATYPECDIPGGITPVTVIRFHAILQV